MKLISFERDGQRRLGLVENDQILDLASIDKQIPTDLTAFLSWGEQGREAAQRAARSSGKNNWIQLGDARPLMPIASPGKIICLGLNYASHVNESPHPKPEYPMLFLRATTSLLADGEPMVRPRVSAQLDYEGELVAVVSRRARHVPEGDALSVIGAYGVFNDGSVRDYQRKTAQWTAGKNFDATGAIGAQMVTADALPPGAKGLKIQTRVNGCVVQSADTSDMLFGVAETVALLSQIMTLEPGDLLVMGTPSGVGVARKPPVFMVPGDLCEVEIEQVGRVCNSIVDEAA